MKMRSRMQNQKGFTLVELMVVVVILGILVAIAVPVYQNVVANANQNAIDSNVRILDSAISMYTVENQEEDITDLDITHAQGLAGGTALSPYLQEWPEGPAGTTYSVTDGKAGYTAAP